jgi:mono/diheme cytochrome c family protein
MIKATVVLTSAFIFACVATIGNANSPEQATPQRESKLVSPEQTQIDTSVRESLTSHVAAMMDSLSPQAQAGYHVLVDNVYLPHDFDDEVVNELVEHGWQSPLGEVVRNSSSNAWPIEKQRSLAAFGIAARPDDPTQPLQYVTTKDGRWVMNCFACHGGSTYGVTFPGSPNTTYALQPLTEEVRRIKLRLEKPLAHMDVGSIAMPLGTTIGTSNAVMFGVALMNYRDHDLNVFPMRPPAAMDHHDMDAPAWWHFQRKTHMYADGFAQKGHKGLMQFMLVRQNGPEKFKAWEKDFANVYAFLSEVKPPKYPLEIEKKKASRGLAIFNANCASCHGNYEASTASYPESNIDLNEIGTDPVRHTSLTPVHRSNYGLSWFADYGKQSTIEKPAGYTAPPLDGIWASAPYFHNGSVPTLRDVLFPDERPAVWRRLSESYNAVDVGLDYEGLDELPAEFNSLRSYERRFYFDTRTHGKSNQGHDFPATLTIEQREDVLEYLKTL